MGAGEEDFLSKSEIEEYTKMCIIFYCVTLHTYILYRLSLKQIGEQQRQRLKYEINYLAKIIKVLSQIIEHHLKKTSIESSNMCFYTKDIIYIMLLLKFVCFLLCLLIVFIFCLCTYHVLPL